MQPLICQRGLKLNRSPLTSRRPFKRAGRSTDLSGFGKTALGGFQICLRNPKVFTLSSRGLNPRHAAESTLSVDSFT